MNIFTIFLIVLLNLTTLFALQDEDGGNSTIAKRDFVPEDDPNISPISENDESEMTMENDENGTVKSDFESEVLDFNGNNEVRESGSGSGTESDDSKREIIIPIDDDQAPLVESESGSDESGSGIAEEQESAPKEVESGSGSGAATTEKEAENLQPSTKYDTTVYKRNKIPEPQNPKTPKPHY